MASGQSDAGEGVGSVNQPAAAVRPEAQGLLNWVTGLGSPRAVDVRLHGLHPRAGRGTRSHCILYGLSGLKG